MGYRRRSAPAGLVVAFCERQRRPGTGEPEIGGLCRQGVSALGIVWNSKSGTPEPKEWRDLTQPAFKDKVTTPDPALSGASLDLLIGLQNSMGDQAWQLFDDLKRTAWWSADPTPRR